MPVLCVCVYVPLSLSVSELLALGRVWLIPVQSSPQAALMHLILVRPQATLHMLTEHSLSQGPHSPELFCRSALLSPEWHYCLIFAQFGKWV